jgi:DMSO/TMAO reductase YedYZ molybdopterin-dependent catalytic subunit
MRIQPAERPGEHRATRGLQLLARDQPGFWEQLGYHDRGDPWREQRYRGDP